MLISLPFLTNATNDDVSGGNTLGETTGKGAFPVSHEFGWHGGIHLQAPGDPNSPEKVRAIADGTVAFARTSNEIPAHDTDPAILAAHPLLYYKGWTSNGVVILKHDTEIGEGVSVTFYSIYQHLHTTQKIDPAGHEVTLQTGDKVYRKDIIGMAGVIYGQPNRIHVEIVADAANVAALMGRTAGPLTAAQGRTTCVWGDMHIQLTAGTPYYATDPREARLNYVVRPASGALYAVNETLASVAAQFATTPERLRQLNAALITQLRQRYPNLREDDWFSAITGTHQAIQHPSLPAPTPLQRTLTVPKLWGDGPAPANVPADLWATWQATPTGRTAAPLIVSLSESSGTLTTRDATGKAQGTTTESSYDRYDRATQVYPGCPSAGYELMRFGRVLGPDALAASDQYRGHVPHLRQVRIDGREVYIDLNVAGVRVCSDADFPHWQGWAFIDDDTDGNSRCDSQQLIDLILATLPPPAPAPSTQEAQAAPVATPPSAEEQARARQRERLIRAHIGSTEPTVRERLSRCVVKMPTEWSRDDIDTRWSWIKDAQGDQPANVLLAACLTPEAYEKFKRHASALAFWEDAQAAGLALDKVHYHFHPKEFIETFKKCGWLSESELTQLLPMSAMRPVGHGWASEPIYINKDNRPVIQKNRVELNKALRKFSIAPSPLRMAAFFGNATVETQWFGLLEEKRDAQHPQPYLPWQGRGFMQLTWPYVYVKYWEFRGRHIDKSLKAELETAQKEAHRSGKNDALQDANHPGVTEEMKQWRNSVGRDEIDAGHSAGAYWAWTNATKFADQPPSLRREIQSVGTTSHVYYSCESFGQVAATVNFGSPRTDPRQIASVNGIVARYQAYANALVVLADWTSFPDASGHAQELPEEFVRRTV